MTEEQFKSLIKLAILELMNEHRDLLRELLRELLRDALRDLDARGPADAMQAGDEAQRAIDAAKREEILSLLGTTI